jgi:hypothetical protein
MVHNLNRRIREDLARKERTVAGDGSSGTDGSPPAERVAPIGRTIDVVRAAPDLPDLIEGIDLDDDRTTIDVLTPDLLLALEAEDAAEARAAQPQAQPAPVVLARGTDEIGAVEPPTVAYRHPIISLTRRAANEPSVIADLDDDEPRTVMQRRPTAPHAVAAPAAPAPVAEGLPWRVTAEAGDLRFEAERRSRIVIGSMPSCDWVIAHPAVRAVHCELVYDDGWVLSARAAVRFLGLDVEGWTPVSSGDVIGVGGVSLRLEFARLDDDSAMVAPSPPPVAAPVEDVVPVAIAPSPSAAIAAKSAAEDAVFRLPEAEDTAAPRVATPASPARRAVLGLVVLAVLGGLYVSQRATRSAPKRGPAAAAPAATAPVAAAPARPSVTLAEPALATSAREGVNALLDGNYRSALLVYRRVAADKGGETADIFVRALESRLAAPCRRAGRPIKECMP